MILRITAAVALAAATLSGCCTSNEAVPDGERLTDYPERPANMSQAEYDAYCKQIKAGAITTVNAYCPVMLEDPVDPTVTPAAWKGTSVGFCCMGCLPKWTKLTDAQKDAAVAAAVAKGKPAT